MKFTASALSALLLVATNPGVTSFLPVTKSNDLRSRATAGPLFLSPEELTNYMAKAHEEKLRAVSEVEGKKNAEIQTLKTEVTELKEQIGKVPKESAVVVSTGASTPPSTGADLSKLTIEELRAKLVQYQEFMAKYIVQAQQQKMKAVRAAELATAARYEAKIKLLLAAAEGSSAPATAEAVAPASSSSSPETKLYDTRSANVAAAAKAGKSRWGDKEVAKVKITEPKAVDLKADEPVNGAVKANGVAATTAPEPVSLPSSSLFDGRNKKIAEAAAAGKSRWGDAEVKKATTEASKQPSISSAPEPKNIAVTMSPEIEAADHGLRNDGGVGGPSLAERVNLGQQLFTGGTEALAAAPASAAAVAPVSVVASNYDLRNARVAAAAAAGKSRWGSMEIAKATTLASNALPTSSNGVAATKEIVSSPEIEAADHGLRNDGGVGGPSLAERVNLGLGLLND